jgi:aspartate 1-decarboxylase
VQIDLIVPLEHQLHSSIEMRLRSICKSKIHHAVVTGAELNYIGSIGIDSGLMKLADLITGEKVAVWNVTTGARIETYAIPLPEDSGEVVVNGAAAHHFTAGDRVIIVAYELTDEVVEPRMILVDDSNAFVRWLPKEDQMLHQMEAQFGSFD